MGNGENAGYQHFLLFSKCFENIVGNGKNAGYQHFLFFSKCFQNTFVLDSLKDDDSTVKRL